MSTHTAELPASMKAMQFVSVSGGIESQMKLNSAAIPPSNKLSAQEVSVEVLSMAVNSFDYKLPETPLAGGLIVKRPSSPGVDYCGRVISAANDSGLKTGQIVFGKLDGPTKFGTLGQYITAPLAGAVPVPPGVNVDHAAAVGLAGLAAYQSIVPNVKSGDSVFINGGSGGTGIFGIQIAKIIGCHVTTSCSTLNVQMCRDLGADEVLDYSTTNISKELRNRKAHFQLVVDNVGSPDDLYYAANDYLKADGKFIQVGAEMSLGAMWKITCRSVWPSIIGGGKRSFAFFHGVNKKEDFAQIVAWMQEGKIKVIIDSTYEFEDAAKAYAKLRTGHVKGKLVVHVTKKP